MNAFDTNVLVYAHRFEASENAAAFALLHEHVESKLPWAIPWPCLHEFYAVVTNQRIWKDAVSTPEQAWAQIDAWIGSPSLRLIGEPSNYLGVLRDVSKNPRVRGSLIHDARIVAICLAHGVDTLYTADRDFSLFPQLRIANPFA